MHLLPTTLAAVADIAEVRENTRYAVTGVHLEVKEDNTYRVDATDTKFLLRVTGECTGPADEYPMSPALEAAPNSHCKGLIPRETWHKAFSSAAKLTKRVSQPILQSVAVKIGKDEATFGMTNLESSPVETTKLAEGRFPPVDQFIPKRQRFAFSVDGARLAKLMKAMTSVCPGENEGRIDFYLGGGLGQNETADRIILKRSNASTEALGLIVPLVVEESAKGPNPIVMGGKETCVRFLEVNGAKIREEDVEALQARVQELEQAGTAVEALQVENRHLDVELAALRAENQRLREELARPEPETTADRVLPAEIRTTGMSRAERIAALKASPAA